jgi:hypothetical protein
MGYFVSDPIYVDEERLQREEKESYRSLFIFYLKCFCLGLVFIMISDYWDLGMVDPLMESLIFIILHVS